MLGREAKATANTLHRVQQPVVNQASLGRGILWAGTKLAIIPSSTLLVLLLTVSLDPHYHHDVIFDLPRPFIAYLTSKKILNWNTYFYCQAHVQSDIQVPNPKSKVQRKGTGTRADTIILQATTTHPPPITFLTQNVNPVMGKDHQ